MNMPFFTHWWHGILPPTVCYGRGKYARDEDGDSFHEIHENAIEGFWSLLRSWLRLDRGISQEELPLYPSSFRFVHNNTRIRGEGSLKPLLELLVAQWGELSGIHIESSLFAFDAATALQDRHLGLSSGSSIRVGDGSGVCFVKSVTEDDLHRLLLRRL